MGATYRAGHAADDDAKYHTTRCRDARFYAAALRRKFRSASFSRLPRQRASSEHASARDTSQPRRYDFILMACQPAPMKAAEVIIFDTCATAPHMNDSSTLSPHAIYHARMPSLSRRRNIRLIHNNAPIADFGRAHMNEFLAAQAHRDYIAALI